LCDKFEVFNVILELQSWRRRLILLKEDLEKFGPNKITNKTNMGDESCLSQTVTATGIGLFAGL